MDDALTATVQRVHALKALGVASRSNHSLFR